MTSSRSKHAGDNGKITLSKILLETAHDRKLFANHRLFPTRFQKVSQSSSITRHTRCKRSFSIVSNSLVAVSANLFHECIEINEQFINFRPVSSLDAQITTQRQVICNLRGYRDTPNIPNGKIVGNGSNLRHNE